MRGFPLIRNLAVLALLVAFLGLVACSDDDPAAPNPGVDHPELPFPTTPDSLVALYRTALAEMDTLYYPALLAPDFRYNFSPVDTALNHLTTDFMTRSEALQAADNMFDGVSVQNSLGQIFPAVARIQVFEFAAQGPWEIAGPDAPFPDTEVCRHFVRIHLERDFGLPTLSIIGNLDVYARAVERTDNQGTTRTGYQMAGLVDPDTLSGAAAKENGVYTWGMGFFNYLDNLAPNAPLQVRSTGTFPLPGFELDATGSGDEDSGLHPFAYRWRAAADSAWTTWRSASLMRFTYTDTGAVTVGVEVRDRWGLATRTEVAVQVPAAALEFPDSPDQLMANLRTVYDNRVTALVNDLLAPGHVSYLDSSATAAYPDLGGLLSRADELGSSSRLFSGDDVIDSDGQVIPGVGLISFSSLVKQGEWSVAGAGDRVPGAQLATYTLSVFLHRWSGGDLQVDGTVDFYATARDSLIDGVAHDFWQLVAQDDLGPAAREIVPVSWSAVKAMYLEPSRKSGR